MENRESKWVYWDGSFVFLWHTSIGSSCWGLSRTSQLVWKIGSKDESIGIAFFSSWGWLMFAGHFPQKSQRIRGYSTERDLKYQPSAGFFCMRKTVCSVMMVCHNLIGWLIFACHFLQKSPRINGWFAGWDLKEKPSCGGLPPCTRTWVCSSSNVSLSIYY